MPIFQSIPVLNGLKQIFVLAMMFFSCKVLNVNSLKYVPMNNQECKVRPKILTVMSLYFILKGTIMQI